MANERRTRQKELEAAKKAAAQKAASRKELFKRIRIAFYMGTVVVLVLVLINFLGSGETGQPDRYLALRDQPTACGAETPPEQTLERWIEPADQALDPGSKIMATIATSCGEMVFELDPSMAPQSVNDFVFLARQGAYDGTVFDFVDPSLWVQAGDPTSGGDGSHFMQGRRISYRTPDEFPPTDFEMQAGVLGMTGDRASRGTGFFVVTGEDVPLSNRFNVMGHMVEGTGTIDRIAEIERNAPPGSGARTAPVETVYIESVAIDTE